MAKTETKKTNKKTLGAVFCALSLGVAGVTGLMLNDSNKKYDELKKSNTVQIEQHKTEKTALQTQLEAKQTQLEELQADATANASQIAQLLNEIQTLENQLENFEYINKTIENMTITYSHERLMFSGYFNDSFYQLTAEPGYEYGGSYLNDFKQMTCSDIALYDCFSISSGTEGIVVSFQKGPRVSSEFNSTLEFVDENNEIIQELNFDTSYNVLNFEYIYTLYTEEEVLNLGYSTEYEWVKDAQVKVKIRQSN